MQPRDDDGDGRQREDRRVTDENVPADDQSFLVLPPVAQADDDGDDRQRIPPRRRGVQKMKQPRELRKHEEKLAQ
jgi:hypothetical protein